MTSSKPAFLCFAWFTFIDVIRRPDYAIAQVAAIDARRCVQFAWLCFFISTVVPALFDLFLIGPMLDAFLADPVRYAQIAEQSGVLVPSSFDEFLEQRKLFLWVTIVKLVCAPVTSLFFPYLIAGAIFVLLSTLSLTKTVPGSYDHVIKLVCIAQAPLVFCVIPIFGPFVGNIWCLIFVVRAIGSLFHTNVLGRLSATALCFLFLFSIWNSTVAQVATVLKARDWTWIK